MKEIAWMSLSWIVREPKNSSFRNQNLPKPCLILAFPTARILRNTFLLLSLTGFPLCCFCYSSPAWPKHTRKGKKLLKMQTYSVSHRLVRLCPTSKSHASSFSVSLTKCLPAWLERQHVSNFQHSRIVVQEIVLVCWFLCHCVMLFQTRTFFRALSDADGPISTG